MQFRVLGPLEALDSSGTPRLPNGAKARLLLAALLIEPGEVVSSDRLIDLLWTNELPSDPANALQARISALRRSLNDPDILTTRSPGYAIDLTDGDVDAVEFERLVGDARAAESEEESLKLYETALSSWRGSPYGEFAYLDFFRPEILRLEELWHAAREERIRLMIDTGRQVEVLGELEGLVAEHPLREGLWELLMLALYRSGRQADALRAYGRAAAALGEELGIEPSQRLRDLEEAILTQSPSIAGPHHVQARPNHNLPTRLSSLVGRSKDIERVTALLGDHRLITLTGPGGVGKTSLSLACGEAMLDDVRDGIWLVELAPLRDPELVPIEIARSLGLEVGDTSTIDLICTALSERRLLIILDNCEHLVGAAALASVAILQRAPGVKVIATSREPLGVPGEMLWPTRPLETPPEITDGGDIAAYDAVRLFLERAKEMEPDLKVEEDTLTTVGEICRRLDGLPLALELAAARVRSLPVTEIAARLEDRFKLLTSSARTALPRQTTLEATIAWSYDLLSSEERELFRRLAVFAGGWDLGSLDAVTDGVDMFDDLTHLVDKSLVIADHSPLAPRYSMLETIRVFAMRELIASGAATEVTLNHARWFTDLAESASFEGPDQEKWANTLSAEHENLLRALERCIELGETSLALRLGSALGWLWFFGNRDEGRTVLDGLLTATRGAQGASRVGALIARARLDMFGPSQTSRECALEAMETARTSELALLSAQSKVLVASGGTTDPDVRGSLTLTDEALSEFRDHRDQWGEAFTLFWRMELMAHRGDLQMAIDEGLQALAVFRRTEDPWAISATLTHLGKLGRLTGLVEWAEEMCGEGLDVSTRRGLPHTVQYAMTHQGYLRLLTGDYRAALERFETAMPIAVDAGNLVGVAAILNGLAESQTGIGSFEEAQNLHVDALRRFESLGLAPDIAYTLTRIGLTNELVGRWEAAADHHRRGLDQAALSKDVITLVPCLEGFGRVAAAEGAITLAARLLRAGESLRKRSGLAELPIEQSLNAEVRAMLAAALSPWEVEQLHGLVDSMTPETMPSLIA